jgi:peptide/nickel transport system substrate-binding protein/oligopeptide transport system substrate-binding protein
MTADDVKYSFERLVKMKSARVIFISTIKGYKDLFDGKTDAWAGIEVVDKYTVRFTLDTPYAPFLAALTYTSFGVVPKEDAEKLGKDFNFSPVGTGPFALQDWKQDNVVSFRKNPDYWRKDAAGGQLPYLDGVDLVIMPDYGVAYMELKKGNLHVLEEVTDEYYADAKKEFGKGYQERPALQNYYYGLSQIRAPFKDNLKLRQRSARCSSTAATCRPWGFCPPECRPTTPTCAATSTTRRRRSSS